MALKINQKSYRADGSHATFNDSTISCSDGKFEIGILDGIQGMSVKETLDIGEEREAGSPFAEDVTTGDYSAEGSIDFKAEAWDRFKEKLNKAGIGHFGTEFTFSWTYRRKDNKTTNIVVKGARFSERGRDGKTGNEALKVTVSFKIAGKGARLYENGYDAFGGKL
jgi:hypothetical protein